MDFRQQRPSSGVRRNRPDLWWVLCLIVGSIVLTVFLVQCAKNQSVGRLGEAMAPPTIEGAAYVGMETCLLCHEDQAKKMEPTLHGKIMLAQVAARTDLQRHGCEACHGPGSKHVDDPMNPATNIRFSAASVQTVASRNAVCLQCHGKGQRMFWQGSPHELRDVACTACHSTKSPKSRRAQLQASTEMKLCSQCHAVKVATFQSFAHMPVREGKMQCSSCHNPHGTVTDKLMKGNSVNETCYSCHAEKAGPFLWEHPPVREDCMTCHNAHGSNNVDMLKIRAPRLCQQCHNAPFHPSEAFANLADRRVLGRSCVGCHANIHGSNHPSGFRFTR